MIKALFPGTFDPIHYGHIDIAIRASKIFDQLIIGVYETPSKNILFSAETRLQMVKESFESFPKIIPQGYSGMTVDFCRSHGVQVLVRGLRVFSDFEYEFRMSLANRRLDPNIETISLITSEDHTFISSTTVKEIAQLGGDVSSMVPPHVDTALKQHFLNNH